MLQVRAIPVGWGEERITLTVHSQARASCATHTVPAPTLPSSRYECPCPEATPSASSGEEKENGQGECLLKPTFT